MSTTHERTHELLSGDADELRHRLDLAQGLATAREGSLTEVAAQAHELRCQTAELCDSAHSSLSLNREALKRFTLHLDDLADTLSRAAGGYTGLGADDMGYPEVISNLEAHGWSPVPDRTLDGTVPPGSRTETSARQGCDGYLRGWTREAESIQLWFTSPRTLSYAWASPIGRLHEATEVRAIACSSPGEIKGHRELQPGFRWPQDATFDASCDQVCTYLEHCDWKLAAEYPCTQHGRELANCHYRGSTWQHPSHPERRLFAWGADDEPAARVGYWAGPVRSLTQLSRLTNRQ